MLIYILIFHATNRIGGASSSGAMGIKAVSLSDVTAHITPTSVTSPVSTAAKITVTSAKSPPSGEGDVAFPAVLKGSQKQRVPPPVPPRGSPKAKRGGGNSQSSSIDTKGDYPNLSISVSDIPPQTPITSSDDDFCFYGHDFKFKEPVACRIPPSVSEHSIKMTQLVASNSFLDFVEEGDSITERSHPGKDLIAQTTMMARFNIDTTVREHLDSGDYHDTSFTESSSEERIIVYELPDQGTHAIELAEIKGRQSKSPTQFIKGMVSHIGDKLSRKSPIGIEAPGEKLSVHNVRSSDLISAAKSLKRTPRSERNFNPSEDREVEQKADKNGGTKPGIISGLTKRLNFNQSKRDKNRPQEIKKPKPKVEIKTYTEQHSRGMTKDEVICHRKAKNKIDMFQKHIWKVQSDSENSSRRSSFSSSQDSKRSEKTPNLGRHVLVKETKKLFEPIKYIHESSSSLDKKSNFSLNVTSLNPIISKSISGNVHDKIKKFSETSLSDSKMPQKVPRQKKKGSFKKRSARNRILKMRKEVEEVI
ncbi:uncharacterized protein LOC114363621 [Ostrinia furnacalis]|uniref:uncharacterized protein LOC114363621 n=1 Tax=Ostrinia furnacalis TaxID=93504 RepID=UPI00103A58A9|nr:uncharacterized protein LOC114363621 [Ostrinia furnacalis]